MTDPTGTPTRHRVLLGASCVGLALALSACGSSSNPSASTGSVQDWAGAAPANSKGSKGTSYSTASSQVSHDPAAVVSSAAERRSRSVDSAEACGSTYGIGVLDGTGTRRSPGCHRQPS